MKYALSLMILLLFVSCGTVPPEGHSVPNDGAEIIETGPTRLP